MTENRCRESMCTFISHASDITEFFYEDTKMKTYSYHILNGVYLN